MKTTITLLTSLLLLSCATLKNTSTQQTLTILSATSQKWHGGTAQSGSGTRYVIKAVAQANNLVIDSLYLANYIIKLGVTTGNKEVVTAQKGDTLLLRAGVNSKTQRNTSSTPNITKDNGQISLSIKGEKSFVTVKKFEVLKELYYP